MDMRLGGTKMKEGEADGREYKLVVHGVKGNGPALVEHHRWWNDKKMFRTQLKKM
jgi:hypothetical protein